MHIRRYPLNGILVKLHPLDMGLHSAVYLGFFERFQFQLYVGLGLLVGGEATISPEGGKGQPTYITQRPSMVIEYKLKRAYRLYWGPVCQC